MALYGLTILSESLIQMLDDYGTDPYITKMVDEFDWYILPVTNPDGYVYTWEHVRNYSLIEFSSEKCYFCELIQKQKKHALLVFSR